MNNKFKLYYDGNCPVCNNYAKLLQKKLNPNKIEFIPTNTNSKDFQLVNPKGNMFKGEKAIEVLANNFPAVKSYFWMLPDKYKVGALKMAYKIGSTIKKIIPKKSGCGCGKKK